MVACIFLFGILAILSGQITISANSDIQDDDASNRQICYSKISSDKYWKLNKRFMVKEEFFSDNRMDEKIECPIKDEFICFLVEKKIEEFQNDGPFLEDYASTIPPETTTEIGTTTTMNISLMKINDNRWNASDAGPEITITEDGLVATISESKSSSNGVNSVRAILPVPPLNMNATMPYIVFYFEMEILEKIWLEEFGIGFCTKQFPLNGIMKWVGGEDSIGILNQKGMWINASYINFENENEKEYFAIGDVVGIGIIYYPANTSIEIETFATWNGYGRSRSQLLGKVKLSQKFATFVLYPAVSMYYPEESIRANFGKEEYRFNLTNLLNFDMK